MFGWSRPFLADALPEPLFDLGRQAGAIVAARARIVDGAVGMIAQQNGFTPDQLRQQLAADLGPGEARHRADLILLL